MEYTVEQLLGELEQALNKIEFLHGCLTDPTYKYAYPEMTLEHIERLQKIVGPRYYCVHSNIQPDCPGCQEGIKKRALWHQMSQQIQQQPATTTKRSECTCICHHGWTGFHGEHTCCVPD